MGAVGQFLFDLFNTVVPSLSPTIYVKKFEIEQSREVKARPRVNQPVSYMLGLSPSELRGIREDIIWAERKSRLNSKWIENVGDKRVYIHLDHRPQPDSPV